MKNRRFFRTLELCVLAIMTMSIAGVASAQVEQGRFVGRISDPQGSVISGASIKVTNTGTNITQMAITDNSGAFVVTPVAAGIYTVSVTAPGFQTSTISKVEVQVGQIVREDLRLAIGSSTVTIDVTTAAPLLATDSATVGQVITNQQLTGLPLNGRGFYRLAELTPGAALLAPTGNSLAIRPEIVNGNVISGIRGSATSFLLDGVDVTEQHQGGTFIQTSIDALQEFSVQQSPYSAEYNRGGAFFNATVKSGTNKFHGGIFEFIRNDKLDARNYFSPTRQILKRNQFGGDLGGPVSIPHLYNGKDRTFFFVDYEGQRLRQGEVFNSIVANQAQRGGNFGTKVIYDPLLTKTVNGAPVRTPFANNTIPTDRLSPQALAIQNYFALPNTNTGTFAYAPSQAIDFDQYTVRLDHSINAHNRLFARWIYVTNREVDPNSMPDLKTASLTSIGQDIAVGVITNIGANKVNEARVHYLPSHVRLSAFLQGPDFNTQFGVAGFAAQVRPGSGGAFPDYSWSGYTAVQGSAFDQRPKSQDRKAIEGTENFTILKGKQSIKFGLLIRYYQWLGYDSETYAGQFNFNGNESGDAYADFLLGYPSSVARAYPADNFGGQQTYKQFFVQDDIRLSERLTINAGLRYEYSPWMAGYKGQVGTFDPSLAKPIIVSGSGTIPDLSSQFAAPAAYQFFGQYIQTSSEAGLPSNITYTDKHQFGPRFGVTYSVTNKTVVRGGFGMFYEPEGSSGRVNLDMLPFRLAETVNQTQNVAPTRSLDNFFLGTALGSAQANPTLVPSKTHLNMGYNEHYSLGLQQQLSANDMLEVGYVGNHGVDLNGTNDFNDPSAGPGSIQGRRPYQPWGTITYNTQDTSTNYNSLQAKLEHRTGYGLSALVAYTYSKFFQFNQAPALGGNVGYEYALSPYDTPQNLAASGSYKLPVGKGQHFLGHANSFVDGALGGWQLQTIVVLRSGVPYTPVISGDVANTGVGGQRPNLNPAGGNPNFKRSIAHWFDQTKYVEPGQYTYGTVHANTLRSDMYRQYDASIFKNFTLPGESVLSFRAEFFNLSNTTSFSPPNASITTSGASATVDTPTGAQITSTSVPSRDIQFALKYNF
ncbi:MULTISPECIES: TonB-dependent receptor [Acidobacteriaceae]|uniref:TonB-dependent receptor n=1 Tax=Acidobacteriaceae TaxID=204434 RepID=UPI00131A8474|nr:MULTISPECIES: TonB-dependent receptor [Acidobacteriaceae]MDW5267675.1 carboxypeptidase regulatory-like domain-containing protein [Edaphobacter sp.]